MDKRIEKKKWTGKKIGYLALGVFVVFFITYNLIFADHSSRYNVNKDRITIEQVREDVFSDYITITGTVNPIKTVFLDAVEGGRVEEIFLEEGSMVNKGDVILRLSNTNLQLNIMNREASLAEQMNELRNTRLLMEQNKLDLKKQILELDYLISQNKRSYNNNTKLYNKNLISREEFEESEDEYNYLVNKKALLLESQKQDSVFRNVQIEQLEQSVSRMEENLKLVRQKLLNLNVVAPVGGQLASINAEIGEAKAQGERLGQINILDSYKVQADIDEHYISRVTRGLSGEINFAGNDFGLKVTKIYPEVRNSRFSVDMEFQNGVPERVRIGQTFRVKLELGESRVAILLPRGGFYQSTGGQWIFVLDENGEAATKRNLRIGRQNPTYYEVLEGLQPGENVVTSSYDNFGEIDKLVIK